MWEARILESNIHLRGFEMRNKLLSLIFEVEQAIGILEIYKSGKKKDKCLKFLNKEGSSITSFFRFFADLPAKSEKESDIRRALELIDECKYDEVPTESLDPMLELVEGVRTAFESYQTRDMEELHSHS